MFLTGEKLQELAEVSVAVNIPSNFNSDLVKTQLNNIRTKCFVFGVNSPTDIPDEIKYASSIFVYTTVIDYFLKNILPKIESTFTLITHNSDDCIDEKFISYLDSPKIAKWFCQNRYINHPKLFSLPIGIANSQWKHGNLSLLDKIRNEDNLKTNLVYKNFDIGTNTNKRSICHAVTESNNIHMASRSSNEEYWRAISKSNYVIAPHGNGVDSHRIWECLYLRATPIVEYHECFSQFKDLPILFVDNYSVVTPEFLTKQTIHLQHTNINKKLDLSYWRNIIKL